MQSRCETFDFRCPRCRTKYRCPADFLGRLVRCPKCARKLRLASWQWRMLYRSKN